MKNLLLAATAAGAFCVASSFVAPPVFAQNTALIMWNGSAVQSAIGADQATLNALSLNGVTVTFSFVNRATHPNQITEGNINIDNTTSSVETLNIIAGANDFVGEEGVFILTGTVGVTSGKADLAGNFYVDASNTLSGETETVTGSSIGTFDSTKLTGPKSFSFNGSGLDFPPSPFSMAERLTLTLQPGAEVFVQGMSMTQAPELSTWAMGLIGFGLLGTLGVRKRLTRYAV